MEIRKLAEKDRGAYKKLMRYAFETAKNTYDDIKWPSEKMPMGWHFGAFDGETLVAGAGGYPFQIRMRSQEFKMSGIGGVATKPEYRNRGLVRDIMIRMFQDMYENDISVSVLYPFKHSFYEMLGYRLVDEQFGYQFRISDIIYKETNYHMKEVERIGDDIRSVYDKSILNFDYIAKRLEIQNYSALYKNNYKFICYKGTQPVGYVIIIFTKPGEERWLVHPERTIVIREAFWLDQTAKQTIFNFLWSHRDQRRYVACVFSAQENIIDLLKTPRIKRRLIFDNSLLRVINVKTVLENLKYPLDNFSVSFRIHDKFCPWNNGMFNLTSEDKKVKVEFDETSRDSADIEIDISYFAQLASGFRTVKDLLEFDFITIDQEKVELLNDLFPKTNNYFRDFF
ncbi:MAG: GNAT family N-acetyltransferase [Promethearchaeota archaeon]